MSPELKSRVIEQAAEYAGRSRAEGDDMGEAALSYIVAAEFILRGMDRTDRELTSIFRHLRSIGAREYVRVNSIMEGGHARN